LARTQAYVASKPRRRDTRALLELLKEFAATLHMSGRRNGIAETHRSSCSFASEPTLTRPKTWALSVYPQRPVESAFISREKPMENRDSAILSP
jgi:hypothetical protein